MGLAIEWKAPARRDLAIIIGYIAERDPAAAHRLRDRIMSVVLQAALHPHIFRPGRVDGTREIIAHPNYVIVYRATPTVIQILSILHSRQLYPP